jgi:hypothetical protein
MAGTAAAGVALSLPSWLLGCGDDERHDGATRPDADAESDSDPRAAPGRGLQSQLRLVGCRARGSRAPRLRQRGRRCAPAGAHGRVARPLSRRDPGLQEVDDDDLTHYVENVTLPSDALQLYWVTGCLEDGRGRAGWHEYPRARRRAAHLGRERRGARPRTGCALPRCATTASVRSSRNRSICIPTSLPS